MASDFTKDSVLDNGYMAFDAKVEGSTLNIPQEELLRAADETQIHTFGWPVGVVLHVDNHKPHALIDGIEAEVITELTYDHWTLKSNGDYSYLGSLFEDTRIENKLFFDTRVVRIAEAIWRIARLYRALKVQGNDEISVEVRHGGLKDRELTVASSSRVMMEVRRCREERPVTSRVGFKLYAIVDEDNNVNVDNLSSLVYRIICAVTVLFDMFKPEEHVVGEIVDSFVRGRIG